MDSVLRISVDLSLEFNSYSHHRVQYEQFSGGYKREVLDHKRGIIEENWGSGGKSKFAHSFGAFELKGLRLSFWVIIVFVLLLSNLIQSTYEYTPLWNDCLLIIYLKPGWSRSYSWHVCCLMNLNLTTIFQTVIKNQWFTVQTKCRFS